MSNVVAISGKGPRKAPTSTAPRSVSGKAARAEWDLLAPGLRARGILTPEVEPLLAAYCGAMALIAECDRELSKRGTKVVIKGANGIPRPHPLIGARNRASQNALHLAKRLGIIGSGAPTPAPAEQESGDADPYADLGI